MKIKIITLVFLGIFSSLVASKSLLEYEEPMALCVGEIVFNTDIDPDLCIYYKGNKLPIDINYDKKSKRLGQVITQKELVKIVPYTLNEAKATQQFHILICNHPQFASDSNTIMYLHVPTDMAYKFYTLTAARKYDEDGKVIGCMWAVAEEFLLNDRIVPDNTIIFLYNADYVEGLEPKSWPLNSNIRLLPSIVMKKSVEIQDINRAIIEARIIALDFNTVHHHYLQNATKRDNKTVVEIKQ
ncbi:MAG: hypothetical protein Q8Q60_01540 [Candidatus Chromulinivorax sp.]|nr:hypothetical protein [Candidatus Chromulinivorax sp.]